jgi:hypothetical protein
MTAEEVQTLIDGVPCDLCNSPPGLQMYLVLAAMIDIANGNPVPDTTQGLISEVNCLLCMVPPGLVPYLMVQALRDISSGGGGGGGGISSGVGPPVAAPASSPALYIDENTGTIYSYYAGAWH